MAQLVLPPIPVYNSETKQLEVKVIVKDKDGLTAEQTQVVETKEGPSISKVAVPESNILYTDDLSDSVEDQKLEYSTRYDINPNSLSVYLNGLNIIKDVEIQSANTFVIDSEYENVIQSVDSLIAIYTTIL